MRQVQRIFGWLSVLLCVCGTVHAQQFTPSETYKKIQAAKYATSGLHLQTDVLPHGTHVGWRKAAQHSFYRGSVQRLGESGVPQVNVNHVTLGLSVWQGDVVDLSGELAVEHASPVVRRVIGDSDGEGLPGNPPVNTPISDVPIGWLLLLVIMYAWYYKRTTSAR